MQQDNNIQQKLQQLENQQLPDLSQMDKHWEGMQAMLQSAAPVNKPVSGFTKLVNILAIVAVLLMGTFLILKTNSNKEFKEKDFATSETEKRNSFPENNIATDSLNDLSIVSPDTNSLPPKSIFSYAPIYADTHIASLSNQGDTLKEEFIFNENKVDQQQLQAELFRQLSKPAQHFLINNKKDTTLVCKEERY